MSPCLRKEFFNANNESVKEAAIVFQVEQAHNFYVCKPAVTKKPVLEQIYFKNLNFHSFKNFFS